MKKLFLSLVAAIAAATATFAQSSLIATLTHEGNVTVFHGNSSFKDAMAAAVDGDVISLAGGIYNATDIKKGITLRGSGSERDTISNTYPTEIRGRFDINIPDSCSSLVIEGVRCSDDVSLINLKNPVFMKSRFKSIYAPNLGYKVENLTMLQCRIDYYLFLNDYCTGTFINCFLQSLIGKSLDISNCFVAYNYASIFTDHYTYPKPSNITESLLKNCMIYTFYSTEESLPSTDMVYNCICFGSNVFNNHQLNNNITLSSQVDWDAMFSGAGYFELTNEAKEKYKGDDGTEVGIYGGSLPYDQHIAKPQITKCNIAQKTTADGKLSVDIEVKGVE